MNVKIRFFGAARDFGTEAKYQMEVPEGCRVSELRSQLGRELKERYPNIPESLIEYSAIADEKRILRMEETVPLDSELSILPPVCGG